MMVPFLLLVFSTWPIALSVSEAHLGSVRGTHRPPGSFPTVLQDIKHLGSVRGTHRPPGSFPTVLQDIKSCGCERVVVVVDEDDPEYNGLKEAVVCELIGLSLPFVYQGIDNRTGIEDIRNIILNHTNDQLSRPTTFVLMTSHAVTILDQAEYCFYEHLRKTGSIFPHSSRWLVLVTSRQQEMDVIRQQQTDSSLDNVAVVFGGSPTRGNKGYAQTVTTFTWRENRTKEPQQMAYEVSLTKCLLFPNVNFGLNGRELTAITMPFILIHVHNDTETGVPEYKGVSIDILNIVARDLNFTYSLFPSVTEKPIANLLELLMALEKGEADFSSNALNEHWMRGNFNVTFSHPVIFDKYVGIYRKVTIIDKSQLMIFPFPLSSFLLVLGTFVYCISVYVFIIVLLHTRGLDRELMYDDDNTHARSRVTKVIVDYAPIHLFHQITTAVTNLVFSLMGMTKFPRPNLISARIILFLLCFSTIIFYAFYTGNLTASITISCTNPQLKTVDDLLDNSKRKCRVLTDRSDPNPLHITDDNVLKRLNESCESVFFSDSVLSSLVATLNSLETNTVLVYYDKLLQETLKYVRYPNEYTIMQEAILNSNFAFVFPPQSDIAQLFSRSLLILHEIGVIGRISTQSIDQGSNRKAHDKTYGETNEDTFVLSDLKYLAILVAVLSSLAFLILVAEWIAIWIKKFHRKRMDEFLKPRPEHNDKN